MTAHFTSKETACKCGCGFNSPAPALLALAEKVRALLETPMIVTSCCRCVRHNAEVGGEQGSRHTKGEAMDFKTAYPPMEVFYRIREAYKQGVLPELGGLGVYDWGVHIDIHKKAPNVLRTWDRRRRR